MTEERIHSSQEMYKGKIFRVKELEVETKNGLAKRELVEHNGGACIVALNDKKEILLVKQYRVAYQDFLLELPAGKIDPGEDPKETIIRELQEECAYLPKSPELLLKMYPSPGYINEIISIFYCDDLEESALDCDPDEEIEILSVSLDEAIRLIKEDQIRDAKSVCGILLAQEKIKALQ